MAFPTNWRLKRQRSIQFSFRKKSCSYTRVSVRFNPIRVRPMTPGIPSYFIFTCGAVQMSLRHLHSPDGPGSEHCPGPFVLFLFPFKHKELRGHFLPENRHHHAGHFQSTCSGHRVSVRTPPCPNSSQIMAQDSVLVLGGWSCVLGACDGISHCIP